MIQFCTVNLVAGCQKILVVRRFCNGDRTGISTFGKQCTSKQIEIIKTLDVEEVIFALYRVYFKLFSVPNQLKEFHYVFFAGAAGICHGSGIF